MLRLSPLKEDFKTLPTPSLASIFLLSLVLKGFGREKQFSTPVLRFIGSSISCIDTLLSMALSTASIKTSEMFWFLMGLRKIKRKNTNRENITKDATISMWLAAFLGFIFLF